VGAFTSRLRDQIATLASPTYPAPKTAIAPMSGRSHLAARTSEYAAS